jgi:hypothetical protein
MKSIEKEKPYHKPCCKLLKKKSSAQGALDDPATCTELLECLSKHCVLMKQADPSRVKVDQEQGQCYFLVDPVSTRKALNEITETITLEGLIDYYKILDAIESSLAKNPLLQEMISNFTLFLATLRSREQKFGSVPATVETSITRSAELSESQPMTLEHPRLEDKPQFDGAPPSQTPIINNNPSAAENVNRLQNQHQAKPGFNPRPQQP